MRWYFILALPAILALALAAPYTANRLLNLGTGPYTTRLVQHDGSVTTMTFDANMPPPSWLALPPGTTVTQSVRSFTSNARGVHGSMNLVVPMELPALKNFFTQTLTARGFAVTDGGQGKQNQAAADYLGVSGFMAARRAAGGEVLNIQFREQEGWFRRACQIQLTWTAPN